MPTTTVNAPLMISVSGVRGIIGQSLTPQVATEFGQAFGHFLKTRSSALSTQHSKPTVAIGRDSRPSGPMIFCAVAAGLMSVGVNVVDVDIATTPSVALIARYIKANAAIVITASHNPIIWNGIKFLRHDGIAYPPDQAAQIKQIYLDIRSSHLTVPLAPIESLGLYSTDSRVHAHHIQTVLQLFDTRAIAEKRFKVVLDSVNGAGCIGTPMLLSKLGAELIHMNDHATGHFAHIPEPTKENLTDLCAKVKEKHAAVGFAQDPDADRLAIVDENGTYIGEEYTLALCTYARMLVKPVPVVANLSTSRMVDDIAAQFGQQVYRTAVGEANVAGKMQEVAAANARSIGVPPMGEPGTWGGVVVGRNAGVSPAGGGVVDGGGNAGVPPAGGGVVDGGGNAGVPPAVGGGVVGVVSNAGVSPAVGEGVSRNAGVSPAGGGVVGGGGEGSVIGGEGNGGIIDLRVGPVRDSFLGIAMILDLLTRTNKPLSQIVASLPHYAMIKTKFECTPEQSAALVAKVKQQFADQKLNTTDGVRIDWPTGWVHVRQSNTEPIARVIAEAPDEKTANDLIQKVQSLRE